MINDSYLDNDQVFNCTIGVTMIKRKEVTFILLSTIVPEKKFEFIHPEKKFEFIGFVIAEYSTNISAHCFVLS